MKKLEDIQRSNKHIVSDNLTRPESRSRSRPAIDELVRIYLLRSYPRGDMSSEDRFVLADTVTMPSACRKGRPKLIAEVHVHVQSQNDKEEITSYLDLRMKM